MKKQIECERSRREFIQSTLLALAALPLSGAALSAFAKPADTKLKEDDPVAMSMGYKINAAKVDIKKFPKREGAGGSKQFCDNCQFYVAKNDGWGSCQVLTNGLVAAKGWCNSWALKPGTVL